MSTVIKNCPGRVRGGPIRGPRMTITTVHFDGQEFVLLPEQNIDDLKPRIIAAVIGAPAFVDFEAAGRGHVSVLITSASGVRFEIVERAADESQSGHDVRSAAMKSQDVEVDRYYEHFAA